MKVLVVEDDPTTRASLTSLLQRYGYDVIPASNGTEALEILTHMPVPPQLILADWVMPEMDGIELCKRIRGDKTLPYCYIILLSGRDESEDVVRGLDAGADAYVIKPYNPTELQSRIRAGARILKLNARLEQANQTLQVTASTDMLTSLLNRGAIMNVLQDEFARALRDGTTLSIVMADIDYFKAVNDTYGHIAGDHVLREFAVLLNSGLRTYDSVGRYGGEEFMIIMPNIRRDASEDAIERLRSRIEKYAFQTAEKTLRLTSSFGIAWGRPADFGQPNDFIRIADSMLYTAKTNGRNRFQCADVVESARPVFETTSETNP
ncbi:MAG: diguanylate cyclase [Candidatus Hydrogenedentota bacterium]